MRVSHAPINHPLKINFGIPRFLKRQRKGTQKFNSFGFGCPHCGAGQTRVSDTRPNAVGEVRRRRVCMDCEFRFTTFEMYRPDCTNDFSI